MITSRQYAQFMDKLATDQREKNSLNLSEWEQRFVKSFCSAGRTPNWFTAPRAASADELWLRHGPELNFPHPLDTVPNGKSQIAEADEDGCEFLSRPVAGAPQERCNGPAVCYERRGNGSVGLRYCQAHREQVERAFPGIKLVGFSNGPRGTDEKQHERE